MQCIDLYQDHTNPWPAQKHLSTQKDSTKAWKGLGKAWSQGGAKGDGCFGSGKANKTSTIYVPALFFLFSRHLFVTNAGTSKRFREWPGYKGVQWGQNHSDFLLHNMKALQGKPLSHPMKLPGNGANSNATTIPMTAWPKYHRGSTLWVNFCHDKSRTKFYEDDQGCWQGEKASKKHRRDLKDTAKIFYPFQLFSCLMKLSKKVKLPSKSKLWYC